MQVPHPKAFPLPGGRWPSKARSDEGAFRTNEHPLISHPTGDSFPPAGGSLFFHYHSIPTSTPV